MKNPVVHYDEHDVDYNWKTKCGIGSGHDEIHVKLTWRGVTCKNCLKHKPTKRRKK